MLKKKKLVLASGSPRRKELLGHLNINFNVHPSDVVEETDFTAPTDVVIDLAKLKGDDIFSKEDSHSLIISSDTIVVIDDKILGKPNDREHAKEMLESLSG
ncbi:MAG: Maf family protein, partial [Bdellovibrionota bacterium]|nr:Maf family protein [Bdellovibrionota bacterium]